MSNRGDRRRRLAKLTAYPRPVTIAGKEKFDATDLGQFPDPRQTRRLRVTSQSSLGLSNGPGADSGIHAALSFTPVPVPDIPQIVAQLQPAGVGPDDPIQTNGFTETSPAQNVAAADTSISPREIIVGGNGDMRYFGPPSGISLVSTATPGKSGQKTPESWSKWTHPSIEPVLAWRATKPLPSWTEAFSLVSEFFTHEHQVFPCFKPPLFMSLLGQQYAGQCTEGPTWWVSLNAVLAIAQRRRAEIAESSEAEEQAWGYASNALAGAWDILMRSTQLSSVQALLAVAWFFIGTPNPQPSFMLVGCAVRLAHSIGIHVDSQDPSLSAADSYMRKKVFWIAICLDRELCLRTGRPPCYDLNAVYVDPPMDSQDETEIVTTTTGLQVNLFKAQTQLAVIQSSTYQQLHSRKSPTVDLSESISNLRESLARWCGRFAPSLSDNLIPNFVNRAHGLVYWASPNQPDISTLSSTVKDSIGTCIDASRAIICLTKLLPNTWKSFHWDIVPIAMSAVLFLCTNTLRNPVGEIAENDMNLISDVLQIFKTLDESCGNTYLAQVRKVCHELYRKAKNATESPTVEFAGFHPGGDLDCQVALAGYREQADFGQGAGVGNDFEVNLNAFEQAMPYPVQRLWDLERSLWAPSF
ncbi:transcriptional activator Mut3p [Fusarium beomiforme]|uniref:Transcriptional activator Mut3p n=1 Tax=Fusarium beomiforme TaxID=44412 RepID=A0A9P5AB06_9HYPO|nr:transcriptional activator Mut3p [Fusarium beomiforme]